MIVLLCKAQFITSMFKKNIEFLFVLSALFLLLTHNAYGSHPIGGEIRSTQLNKDSIKINLKFYRDCSGAHLCNSCGTESSPQNCTQPITIRRGIEPIGISHNLPQQNFTDSIFGVVNLPIKPGKNAYDLMQLCQLTKSICNNCNTRTPGTFAPGIEIYEFEGITNIAHIPNSVCWLTLGYSLCCNQNYITNLINPAEQIVYFQTTFNRCAPKGNSTANLLNNPVFVVCSGVDHSINLVASDPDSDSLSYRLGTANSSNGVSSIYLQPFTSQAPFVYLGFPLSSPPLQPPLGININAITGEIKFRPMGALSARVVFEVLEWRTINGVPTLMAITARNFVLFSQICPLNENPILVINDDKGKILDSILFLNVCTSNDSINKCLYVSAKDANRSWDTTDIEINYSGNPNLLQVHYPYNKLSRNLNGPRFDSIRICFNGPTPASASFLNIVARDRACSITARASKTFKVVVQKANPAASLNSISTGLLRRKLWINFEPNTSLNKDSLQISYEYPLGSNSFMHLANGTDTIPLFQFPNSVGGLMRFKIRYLSPCGMVTFIDSIEFKPIGLALKKLHPPTCHMYSNGMLIMQRFGFGSTWIKTEFTSFENTDTLKNLSAGHYWIQIIDSIGNKDSIRLYLTQPETPITLGNITTQSPFCHNGLTGSIRFSANGGTPPVRFGLNQNALTVDSVFQNLPSGVYIVKAQDNNNCIASDTVKLDQPDPIQIQFTTQADSCTNPPSGKITCNITGGTTPYYLNWINYNQSGQTEINKLTQGYYYLRVTDQKACVKNDSVYLPLANTTLRNDFCKVHVPNPLQNKVELTWFKPTGKKIQAYQIYEAVDATSPLILKETRASSANPILIDSIGNTKTKRYQIWSVDSCGRNSLVGIVASGITINTNALPNNMPKITWNTPQINGQVVHYNIYRKGSTGNFVLIRTLFGNQTEFVDSNYFGNGQTLQYYVEANTFGPCGLVLMNSWAEAHQVTGTPMLNLQNTGFKLFPNPAKQHVTIENSGNETFNTINLYGLQGKLIETYVLDHASKTYTLSLPQLAKGMYYLGISNNQTKLINLPLWVE